MKFNENKIKITVVGLGYVGLPLAVEFSKKYQVVGFDLDKKRIQELKDNYDRTNEIKINDLKNAKNLSFHYLTESITDSNIYIVTVPTPVDKNNKPDLSSLISASKTIAKSLHENNIVIYESTVFPGCTEQKCVPILEKYSKLKYNKEFYCGYSPERINPGDKKHTLIKIKKITSGSNQRTAKFVDKLYSSIISAGTYSAKSIEIAEAAKVIENTQRDVNIALINELALIFNKLDIDTLEVLNAAGSKWNFLPFRPGLVGGHCIGVDPYYLTQKALEVGYHPEMILAGRRINDNMGYFIAEKTISELAMNGIGSINAKIAIMGLTFKENCPDLRNTKVITIIEKLRQYNCDIIVTDEWADSNDAKKEYGIEIVKLSQIKNQDAVILAVGHERYRDINKNQWKKILRPDGIIIDVKSIYENDIFADSKIRYWRL